MSDRERSSPTLIESGLKNLIGGRDSNYPLISGINGKYLRSFILLFAYKSRFRHITMPRSGRQMHSSVFGSFFFVCLFVIEMAGFAGFRSVFFLLGHTTNHRGYMANKIENDAHKMIVLYGKCNICLCAHCARTHTHHTSTCLVVCVCAAPRRAE